jgi:hypothetical protein
VENVQTILDALKRLKKALKTVGQTQVSPDKKPSKLGEGQTALFGDEPGIKVTI